MTNSSDSNKAVSRGRRPRRGSPNDGRPVALSAAAMGRALVLLATSCAAFRSSHHSFAPSLVRPRGVTSRGRVRRVDRGVASLRYCDEDEDRPAVVQEFVDAVARRAVFRARSPSSSAAEADERRAAMDEYLDFVRRRTDRLHQGASLSGPGVAALSPATAGPATTLSFDLSFVRKFGPMANFLQRLVAAFTSSVNVATRMILLDKSGLPAASLAILFLAHPLLKGVLRQS